MLRRTTFWHIGNSPKCRAPIFLRSAPGSLEDRLTVLGVGEVSSAVLSCPRGAESLLENLGLFVMLA